MRWPLRFAHGRQLLAGLAGLLILAAVAFGAIYLVLFRGSAPRPLALPSASPSSLATSPASPQSGQIAGTWNVAPGSVAGYRVREQLASLAAPSDAVGRTSSVTGTLTLEQSANGNTVTAASFTVDVSTLSSDSARRDQRIHQMGLQSDLYPTATFTLTGPIALPALVAGGQPVRVSAGGELTIHGTTKGVSIPIEVQLSGSQIQAVGSVSFPFSAFNMVPPSIGGFVSVQDSATVEFSLMLQRP
jgi:polyisoprenoid-binding protein YceI